MWNKTALTLDRCPVPTFPISIHIFPHPFILMFLLLSGRWWLQAVPKPSLFSLGWTSNPGWNSLVVSFPLRGCGALRDPATSRSSFGAGITPANLSRCLGEIREKAKLPWIFWFYSIFWDVLILWKEWEMFKVILPKSSPFCYTVRRRKSPFYREMFKVLAY